MISISNSNPSVDGQVRGHDDPDFDFDPDPDLDLDLDLDAKIIS